MSVSQKFTALFARIFRGANGQRRFTATVSLPVMIVICVALAAVTAWSFYMGYMVGKGRNPQADIQAMTGFGQKPQPEEAAQQQEAEPQTMAASGRIPAPASAEAPQAAQPFAAPSAEAAKAWDKPEAPARPAKQAEAASKPRPKEPEPPAAPKFDFVYQAAVFKKTQEAEALRARLDKDGIRAQVKKSGKAFLVLARLRGTESDAQALRRKLEGMKLGKPIPVSKTPVAAKAKRGK